MRPAEETVVRQCAPTLAGIKTGSLFPCPYQSRQQLLADIRRMNRVLVPRGLCLLPMRMGQGRALLYLYRPQALCRDLGDDLACRLLRQAGYPEPGYLPAGIGIKIVLQRQSLFSSCGFIRR